MKDIALTLREEFFPHWLIYALLATIIVLSAIKSQKEMVFAQMKAAFFKPPSTLPEAKENLSFRNLTNYLMLLNYFVVSGLAIYMVLLYFDRTAYWMVFLPASIYFFQLFSLYFVNFISGEYLKVRENIILLNFITHILGIVIIPLLIIWILNPDLSQYMPKCLFYVVILFYIIRLVRGIFMAIHNKVLWFYIILYLCALEIWPIMVGYLVLSPNFIR
ncbi:DUF4271 domain-containing protein [Brumimicrobium aurantiacum]|uniref:DUF4271 domain-containing protein n=1 Tax=Brumimicrobium aurantiacum TaxID=1737063 RepID=A0A3E1EWZ6_9FLAO|nr:DUF4271 domain-containing protein [Brumimicrobium aurantiacum]RFC54085.1 DUF4271 domain-containing protein [Brumimicrobium aurantiacum]